MPLVIFHYALLFSISFSLTLRLQIYVYFLILQMFSDSYNVY
nr:MAG TPA: hypothetical protein [Microviridae sp.]